MPKTRIVRSYQTGKRSEEIPILKENEKIVIATFVPASEKFNGYIEYVIEEQEDIKEPIINPLGEECNAILESANKKLIKVLKLLKEKGLGVEVLTEKLKTGERFEHFHITFQCNCLEAITKEEYELLTEALYGEY